MSTRNTLTPSESNAAETVKAELAEKIGYTFQSDLLPLEALTHKSHYNERPSIAGFNERLEFLGDAVLDLIVAEVLMEMLPMAQEGELTQSRAAMVSEGSLARISKELGLDELIRLGQGEEKNSGRSKPSILSDAVEAVAAAVFLDGGFQAVKETVIPWFALRINQIAVGENVLDPKSALQEQLQSHNKGTPEYRILSESGPDHEKIFEVEIHLGGSTLANGTGRSKKDAEKQAARRALEALERNTP